MQVRIYEKSNISLIIHLTCFGEVDECGLKDILNRDFLLVCSENSGVLKSNSCFAKISIKFILPIKYKSKLIRRLSKDILEKILSESIRNNNWDLIINSSHCFYVLNQQRITEITNNYPDDLNLIELFKENITTPNNDYSILCGIYKTFEKIKVE